MLRDVCVVKPPRLSVQLFYLNSGRTESSVPPPFTKCGGGQQLYMPSASGHSVWLEP
jgi:hypothetical protein